MSLFWAIFLFLGFSLVTITMFDILHWALIYRFYRTLNTLKKLTKSATVSIPCPEPGQVYAAPSINQKAFFEKAHLVFFLILLNIFRRFHIISVRRTCTLETVDTSIYWPKTVIQTMWFKCQLITMYNYINFYEPHWKKMEDFCGFLLTVHMNTI